MHPPILALGYSEAAMLLRQPNGGGVEAVLSIHGRREFPVKTSVPHRLVLCFDDEEAADPADPLSAYKTHLRMKWAAENGLDLNPPTADHARAIIEFAAETRDLRGTVVCHCSGGVSRSPAAALLCLAAWEGDGREQACVAALFRTRPVASPHSGLVRFGDALLGRGGRLIRAVLDARRRNG